MPPRVAKRAGSSGRGVPCTDVTEKPARMERFAATRLRGGGGSVRAFPGYSAGMSKHPLMSALTVALLWSGVVAQAAKPHPCTARSDDAERLACYDRTFG